MAYEQRDMSGSLFPNQRKTDDSHPNVTGKAMVGGVLYYVDAWTKTDKNGNKWQSLRFKRADETKKPDSAKPAASVADMDSDIPF